MPCLLHITHPSHARLSPRSCAKIKPFGAKDGEEKQGEQVRLGVSRRERGGEERAVAVPASLPGCGVGCSISDMVAQMPLSLRVGELGQERGLLGVGGSEHHAAAREILPCTARPEENWQGGWGGS